MIQALWVILGGERGSVLAGYSPAHVQKLLVFLSACAQSNRNWIFSRVQGIQSPLTENASTLTTSLGVTVDELYFQIATLTWGGGGGGLDSGVGLPSHYGSSTTPYTLYTKPFGLPDSRPVSFAYVLLLRLHQASLNKQAVEFKSSFYLTSICLPAPC